MFYTYVNLFIYTINHEYLCWSFHHYLFLSMAVKFSPVSADEVSSMLNPEEDVSSLNLTRRILSSTGGMRRWQFSINCEAMAECVVVMHLTCQM